MHAHTWCLAALAALTACSGDTPQTNPEGCAGWGDLQTNAEVVARMGELPERTIPCVVESLDRPLDVMAVASVFSAQPERCGILRAVMGVNDVNDATFPVP